MNNSKKIMHDDKNIIPLCYEQCVDAIKEDIKTR